MACKARMWTQEGLSAVPRSLSYDVFIVNICTKYLQIFLKTVDPMNVKYYQDASGYVT